jgi:signal transduction histidine kinase
MKRLLQLIGQQPRSAIFAEALLFAIGIGILDYVSGYEVSMFIFYGIPILAVAWWCGRRSAFILAGACALLWLSADALTGHFYPHRWIRIWEPLARFGYFGFVAVAGLALKRQHLAVSSRIALLEHSQQLERQIIEISEREHRRLGRDLHDGLCQYFAAVGCAAASLHSDLTAEGMTEEAALAAELTELLEQGVAQIRDLARGLMPVQMDEAGLPAALEQLAASVSRLQNTSCRLRHDGEVPVQAPSVAIHLYRIAQEAIHNAIRHGGAHQIEIQLRKNGSVALLSVRDDGVGLSRTSSQSGMGLSIMQYRSRVVGGDLKIEEPETGGTVVCCTFPLNSIGHEAAC